MISQIFTQDCFKIITLFSISPGSKHNRKDIQEKIRLYNVPLDKALKRLINSKILKRESNYYSINFEEEYSKKFIDICSSEYRLLKEIPLDVYFLLVDMINYFSRMKGREIYLFGSYSKLIYKDNSDVDIAVIYSNLINKKPINGFVLKIEKNYDKNIEIHYFEKKDFYKNKKDPLIKNIIKDGVRLM